MHGSFHFEVASQSHITNGMVTRGGHGSFTVLLLVVWETNGRGLRFYNINLKKWTGWIWKIIGWSSRLPKIIDRFWGNSKVSIEKNVRWVAILHGCTSASCTEATLIGGIRQSRSKFASHYAWGTNGVCMWMQDGCKVYINSYMSSNGSCFMVTWTIFKNHLLEVGVHKTERPWHSERSQPLVYSIL